MADLNFSQGADPVSIYNDLSGNQMIVNPDGSINAQELLHYQVNQDKVFTLSGTFTAASGGADNAILMIKNPNGSGKVFRIRKLMVGCVVNNVGVEWSLKYAPTITTNGTSQTARNNLIGSATASSSQCFSLPTLSAQGTQIMRFATPQNSSMAEVNPAIDLQANQTLVVVAAPVSNNRDVSITIVWAEV